MCIGEDENDPVFCVTDLLIHLAGENMEKKANKVIEGEALDILVGSRPLKGAEKEAVSKQILSILKEKYDMEEEEGTFTYRISWVLERWIYLVNRPFGEQFFGLGLISDSSELSKKMYDFVVNIIFYESNMVQQLRSPDIAYGTMLAYLGFGGSVIYLIFYWKMMIAFFRKRTENPYFLVITVLMITGLALSLFGDSLSNPSFFHFS